MTGLRRLKPIPRRPAVRLIQKEFEEKNEIETKNLYGSAMSVSERVFNLEALTGPYRR